ncbi:hypothetical protein MM2B0912R_1851 [Mycobacteroides abscessus subsp. bolletii 2B-0912-R]|nr:hypothetical protein MMAS_14920 [Mycobacteroides abscessus subsp. massiliense CCUG 48898 = JCM 15300]EIV15079.1 hypothetical protein MM2B0912R_1851 [Mycobacteroides abscessus subsp. bolletii 2B-0912-R]BAP96362.1 hypothetical protein MMASJCM_1586 [Mycobacteroides abscessus subsp. massiliense CCUG 48898 = JCM 15300]
MQLLSFKSSCAVSLRMCDPGSSAHPLHDPWADFSGIP